MNWLVLAVFGGMIGLDATSFPQVMISRPLVAATLGGLAAGNPVFGATVGMVVEAFHLNILPVGASRYPEAGTAAAAAAFAMVAVGFGVGPMAILLTLGLSLVWGRVAAVSVGVTRRINERLAPGSAPEISPAAIEVRHMLSMVIDFCRGAVVTVSGAAIAWALLWVASTRLPSDPVIAKGGLAILLCGAAAGALTIFGGLRERRVSFLGGLVLGTLFLLLA